MDYIVLDLEWNQSDDEAGARENLPFEIIEIGAIKLNSDRVMVSEFSQLIKPQVYRELHKITSRLIHMQMQELERGRPFVQVMEDFLSWCGGDYMFCTWGPLDLAELQRNMKYYGMLPLAEKPFPFLDIQKLFSIEFEDSKSRRSLEYAVDFLGIKKDIPFHRAFSDAYYTGKVLAGIKDEAALKKYSYDVFNPPKSKKDEVFVVFDTYAKYISRVFPDKQEALSDREVVSSKCYICHKNLRKKIRWFTPNGKHYYCVACCDKHGNMKGKIRIRKADSGVYVIKTTKFISSEEAARIDGRQEHARQMRKKRRQKE